MSSIDDGEFMYVEQINEAIKAYHNGESLGALEMEPMVGGQKVLVCLQCRPDDPMTQGWATIYRGLDGKYVHETPPAEDVIEGEIVEPCVHDVPLDEECCDCGGPAHP